MCGVLKLSLVIPANFVIIYLLYCSCILWGGVYDSDETFSTPVFLVEDYKFIIDVRDKAWRLHEKHQLEKADNLSTHSTTLITKVSHLANTSVPLFPCTSFSLSCRIEHSVALLFDGRLSEKGSLLSSTVFLTTAPEIEEEHRLMVSTRNVTHRKEIFAVSPLHHHKLAVEIYKEFLSVHTGLFLHVAAIQASVEEQTTTMAMLEQLGIEPPRLIRGFATADVIYFPLLP